MNRVCSNLASILVLLLSGSKDEANRAAIPEAQVVRQEPLNFIDEDLRRSPFTSEGSVKVRVGFMVMDGAVSRESPTKISSEKGDVRHE